MEAYNYQWPSQDAFYNQQYDYTQNYYHPSWQNYPNHSWNNNDQDQFYAPSLSYPPPQPQEPKSNLEKLLIEATERMEEATKRMEMRNNQEVFAPELSYPSEFSYQPQSYEVSYQPPPQQEEKSNLEEILARFTESTERSIKSNEESMRNLDNQMKQLADAIINRPQDTLPSNTEIDPKEEGEEQCVIDTLESGKEFQEAITRNLKRSHSDGEEDCVVEYKRSKIWEVEKKDEDDQTLDSNSSKEILIVSPMSVVQKFHNSKEYIRIDLGEGKMNNLDEFKFGGGQQFCIDAMEIKEKTKRRHAMIIFAIEPD